MLRVFTGGLQRLVPHIDLFFARAGDFVIFDSRKAPGFRRRQIGFHIIEIEVETDVTVKVTIAMVARVPFALTPDLARRIEVAPEGGDTVRSVKRRERAVARAR